MKVVDFAVFAIPIDADQDFTLGVRDLPTWPFGTKISRTFVVNTFKTSC
jgi:hypothetical protein